MKKFVLVALGFLSLALFVPGQQPSKSFVNGVTHDGESITADLPESEHIKNIGSRIDRAGMCVFSAIEMAALYQGLEQMRGFRDWCADNYPGGGYPSKVEKLLEAWFKKNNIPPVPYMQYEGNNPEEILTIVNKTERMACVTYGYSPRYGRSFIAHMVNNVMYGKKYGVVLDNNFVGDGAYEWMEKDELIRRIRLQRGGRQGAAWIFVWITPGAPPPPKVGK
jgi:hypothetical protein